MKSIKTIFLLSLLVLCFDGSYAQTPSPAGQRVSEALPAEKTRQGTTADSAAIRNAAGESSQSRGHSQSPSKAKLTNTHFVSSPILLKPKMSDRLRWSPKGKRHSLKPSEEGLITTFVLGNHKPEIRVCLKKSPGSKYYDTLCVDNNRNGRFEEKEIYSDTPSEIRGQIWSSFDVTAGVFVVDPNTRRQTLNPYQMSVWYVEDPHNPSEEKILRFSRNWWLEGRAEIEGTPARILLTEFDQDGIFDQKDRWAIAPFNEPEAIYEPAHAKPVSRHGWLGEKAYQIKSLRPGGRSLVIEAFDPGISRQEEAEKNDPYAEDKAAARSGQSVKFMTDYHAARAKALKENKRLFLDFETTWCGACKMMDQYVYNTDAVAAAFEDVIAVKIDGDQNRQIVETYQVRAYPTLILLSANGRELKRTVGYTSVKQTVGFLAKQ